MTTGFYAELFSEISSALNSEHIDWAVLGAVAANIYRDQARFTTDVDIILALTKSNVHTVVSALQERGWDSIELAGEWLLRAQHPRFGRLDVLVAATSYEERAIARANQESIDSERTIKVLALEDVVILKLFANRYHDLGDIESILMAEPDLDSDYLQKWLEVFELQDRFQPIVDKVHASGRLLGYSGPRPNERT